MPLRALSNKCSHVGFSGIIIWFLCFPFETLLKPYEHFMTTLLNHNEDPIKTLLKFKPNEIFY